MNALKKNGGFTLVELIVVIAILAILAGVAVPAYSGYIKKANDAAVLSELDSLKTAISAANAAGGAITGIKVGADGKTVTITGTLDSKFLDNFKTYYNDTGATLSNNTLTISNSYKIDLSGTSYTSGIEWTSTENAWGTPST